MCTGPCRALAIALLIGPWAGSWLSAAAASEGSEADASALYQQGIRAAKDGRHREAGEAFIGAFELDPNPSLLWNAARSFEAGGDFDRATTLYARYLALPAAKPDKVERARAWLEAHGGARPTEADEAATPPVEGRVLRVTATPKAADSSSSRIVGWTLCGTGIAAAVGGAVAMVLAARSRDDTYKLTWDEDYEGTLATHDRLKADTEVRELAGWMAFGVSAALVGVGMALLLPGADDGQERAAALELSATPHGLGASGTWRF